MAKTKRVVFDFDERSLKSLKEMVQQGQFATMAEVVRESLSINRGLRQQAMQGFTEIIVRNPETQQERVMSFSHPVTPSPRHPVTPNPESPI